MLERSVFFSYLDMELYSPKTDCERTSGQLYQQATFPENCTKDSSYWAGLHLRVEMTKLHGRLHNVVDCSKDCVKHCVYLLAFLM